MQLDLPFLQPTAPLPPRRVDPDVAVRTEFVRIRRARRYILRVRPDGTLRVTIPRGGSRREAEQFVQQQRPWVERERRRVGREHAPQEWRDGSTILFRGIPIRIQLQDSSEGPVVAFADRRVHINGNDIRTAIERELRELARAELAPRLKELAAQHGIQIRTVSIRGQRSRWGSCARNGNITLNFRLVQMPPEIRDYVLLHELMHLKQQNHSIRFWRLVESVYPAYRDAERWLRVQGKALF